MNTFSLEENSGRQATYKEVPWEMSFSNRIPLRESNAIEVQTWDDENFTDTLSQIKETDFLVTWELEKVQVGKIEGKMMENQMFHERKDRENFQKNGGNRKYATKYMYNDIVLICGSTSEIESLPFHDWLFADFDPIQNQLYVVCHEKLEAEIKKQIFARYLLENIGVIFSYENDSDVTNKCTEL